MLTVLTVVFAKLRIECAAKCLLMKLSFFSMQTSAGSLFFAFLNFSTTCSYLDDLHKAGENASDFFNLYKLMIKSPEWKRHLVSCGILEKVTSLIVKVCHVFLFFGKKGEISDQVY